MPSLLSLFSLAAAASAALNATFCSDDQCEEPALGSLLLDENDIGKCHNDFAGKALAVKVSPWSDPAAASQSDGHADAHDVDPLLNIRFYRSIDCFAHCGSGHLIQQFWSGFQTLGAHYIYNEDGNLRNLRTNHSVLQSFEIVRVDEHGDYEPHGYCGIRHGDAQFFRGRIWKWQQVGPSSFREVPIEEWADEKFPRMTGIGHPMHGTVDASGKTKMQQVSEFVWIGVPLEEWDDEVHVRNDKPFRELEEDWEEDKDENAEKEQGHEYL
ncbi:hypothetical protein B0A50_02336 [Salinomyces thailandicus]|uniref:Uncharacterized protein n=1 Tax=Salinomyces thailandicus TaxID=706561 RepID=A0A4V5N5J1_9PEZI|nr:hypothetical protein B0A50_02336 [Salinomyces thailandica]